MNAEERELRIGNRIDHPSDQLIPFVREGRLRALAIGMQQRAVQLPPLSQRTEPRRIRIREEGGPREMFAEPARTDTPRIRLFDQDN